MTEMRTVLLVGGGGHAAVVAEAIISRGWTVAGFLDDDPETEAAAARVGMKRLGTIDDLPRVVGEQGHQVVIHAATGDALLRRRWLQMAGIGARVDSIEHTSAVVSPSARIGEATFIGPRAIVNARAVIGRGVIVNSGAIVEHDTAIGDFAHLAPASVVAGGATIGEVALLGCGAVVLPGISIGRMARVGAGAVVVSDVPERSTVVGVPARPVGIPA